MLPDCLAKKSIFSLGFKSVLNSSLLLRPTIERSLFIAVTLCCGGIFGISWDINWSVIPFGLALQSSTTLSSKSTASTASCLITTSATAILNFFWHGLGGHAMLWLGNRTLAMCANLQHGAFHVLFSNSSLSFTWLDALTFTFIFNVKRNVSVDPMRQTD